MAEETPAEIADLSAACVRFVEEALALTLDYTPETLPILDHYLSERALNAEPEVKQLVVPAVGAYFGQTARRNLGEASWYCPQDDYPRYRLEFAPFFLHFNPIGIALEALEGNDAVGYQAHFQVLDEARETIAGSLQNIDDVRPQDYYTLSVRFEVLDQVASVLRALETHQPRPRVFGPEVYRALSGDDPERQPGVPH